jgi:hypothetical protein
MEFTQEQKIWLIQKHSEVQNFHEVQRQWPLRFLRNSPCIETIRKLVQKFNEEGSVQKRSMDRFPTVLTPQNIQLIGNHFEETPTSSIRIASGQLGIPQTSVHRGLHQIGLNPFRATNVQHLELGDPAQRIQFAAQFCHLVDFAPFFQDLVFWTDESIIRLSSRENTQNNRTWAFENPHNVHPVRQFPEQLHIWCAISSHGVYGPHFFDGPVNGARYLDLLQNFFWAGLRRMPGMEHFVFMQDGAPAHWTLDVRAWLDNHFPQRWIGRGGPIPWPPRSPDLTPCDFFLWGHLKEKVRHRAPQNLQQLREVIIGECQAITPEMCQNACRSVYGRLQRCIANNGAQVV